MALPAPKSPVDICNIALSLLNQKPVTNIDTPTTDIENLCKIHYAQERRAVLRANPWNFAIKRTTVAAEATAPLFGFTEAYVMPSDFIRFLTKHDELGNTLLAEPIEGTDYQFEDGKLLMSSGDGILRMRYVYDNENVSSWEPLFIKLFTHELALRMAPKLKSAPRAIANIKDSLREIKAEAKAIDGQERPPIRRQTSKFLNARRNRSSSVASRYTKFE